MINVIHILIVRKYSFQKKVICIYKIFYILKYCVVKPDIFHKKDDLQQFDLQIIQVSN